MTIAKRWSSARMRTAIRWGKPIPLPGECRGLYSGFGVVPEAVLRVPVFNRVSAFASVGGHYWRESSHVTHAAGVKVDIPKDRDSGFSFAAGAGAGFLP